MEQTRHCRGPRTIEMVDVRRLSENMSMYAERYSQPNSYSWAPPPPPLVRAIRERDHHHHHHHHHQRGGKVVDLTMSSKPNKSSKFLWNDPEMKRRGRVGKYKLYGAAGKVKSSLKKGYRRFKKKYLEIVRNL